MATYNSFGQNNSNSNFNTNSAVENKGLFSRILRGLSSYGMNYDDMIVRNQVGVGINEDPYSARGNSMYDFFSQRAVSSVLNRKSIPYLDKAYADKRRILREYSIKDELRDFISSLADECIVYSDDNDFCSPKALSNDYPQEIQDKYQEYFEKIYNKFGFSDSITAWMMIKDFLIDGYVAVEIIYDDKKKNIIGFNRLRPETLVPAFEPNIGHLWIQFPEDPQLRRIFLDSQIVYISYSTQNDYSETSYVEGLIKPYNQLKILEQTRIMFNIINATIYQKFTIPIKGMSRQRAEEQIGQLIHDYSEEVEWDDSLGTLTMNGSKHLPYNKQIWFPEGDAGSPSMELKSPQGHDLNEETMLKWFHQALKRASKIPMGRFGEGGGGTFSTAAEGIQRDELRFANFVNRLRSGFQEIMLKPLILQTIMKYPEFRGDHLFKSSIGLKFNRDHSFETARKVDVMKTRVDAINSILGVPKTKDDSYFDLDFAMENFMNLTRDELKENKIMLKEKEKKAGDKPDDAAAEGAAEAPAL